MENIEEKQNEGTSFLGVKTILLNDQKAGMEGLNKDEINRIIYEASKGTPYFIFQETRQKAIDSKVHELQMEMKKIKNADRKISFKKVDVLSKRLEKERNLSHSIVHIDMDAFYAAVEMRDNPNLKDVPMAVGSNSMLSTSNYHARRYGVRAAMPGFIAKKLCPNLVIVPCNFDKYRAVSCEIRKIIQEYDPEYSAAGLDEVYLDLTEYIKNKHRKQIHEEVCLKNDACDMFESDSSCSPCNDYSNNCMGCVELISNETRNKMAYGIVEEIRQKIYDVTQLTASAGIAPNTMLAKVCSDQNKPNGQYQINSTVEAVKSFVATLPVKKVCGIGPVQGQILNSFGIFTCADIWSKRDLIGSLFSENTVEFYIAVSLGIGSTTVKSEHKRKSIGNEQTFGEISKPEDLHIKCEELCNDLVKDLTSHKMVGKVIVLKMKTTAFKTRTRNHSLQYYTDDPKVIHKTAKKLLDTEIAAIAPEPLKLRLMGIRMCNLAHENNIASNEKHHITLQSFLERKVDDVRRPLQTQTKTFFTCPICLDEIETSFSDFNVHVNQCLKDQNFSDENTKESEENHSMDSDAELADLVDVPDPDSSSRLATDRTYACPICELKLQFNNLVELNTHIDKCLNKETIKNILAENSENRSKRKLNDAQATSNSKRLKELGKERTIDYYFRPDSGI